MSVIRQDAWTDNEDMMLAEVVLRHIREGSTQLAAFEEIGAQLRRSAAACGFRWNSLVRKKYNTAVELAKKQRKELKKKPKKRKEKANSMYSKETTTQKNQLNINQVIDFLSSLSNEENNSNLVKEANELKEENERLKRDLILLQDKYQSIQKDYRSLLEVMNRARQMIVVNDEKHTKYKNNNVQLQHSKK
jgi:prespore-specific regulator